MRLSEAVAEEPIPLSAMQTIGPLSEIDTWGIESVNVDILPVELLPLVIASSVASQDILGAGIPNAVHCISVKSPTITSGPTMNTISVISGGSAIINDHNDIRIYCMLLLASDSCSDLTINL